MSIDFPIPEIRARCDAATPGPWVSHGVDCYHCGHYPPVGNNRYLICPESRQGTPLAEGVLKYSDAAFIAHARTDLPRALEAIDYLEEKVSNLLEAFRNIIHLDKTLPYHYHDCNLSENNQGVKPGKRQRWLTPREMAQKVLASDGDVTCFISPIEPDAKSDIIKSEPEGFFND